MSTLMKIEDLLKRGKPSSEDYQLEIYNLKKAVLAIAAELDKRELQREIDTLKATDPMYAIGEVDELGAYAMSHGPAPSIGEMLNVHGKDDQFIFELSKTKEPGMRKLFKWSYGDGWIAVV